ncbi:MAG: site-specific DNA-methyltransferase, partial [Cyanobacteria bacterium P01_A01_bin.105]
MTFSRSRAARNRTLVLSEGERSRYRQRLLRLTQPPQTIADCLDRTLHQPMQSAIACLPDHCVDLLILDPPYNRRKTFNSRVFNPKSSADYGVWFADWFLPLLRLLKPTASVYVCCDWQSSSTVAAVVEQHLTIRNRITWEREKGRGAKHNWKNASEDIWFATASADYTFNVDAVKLKRRVMAPYRDRLGQPKDWQENSGGRFRATHPSNLWTDISVPFWSMPENTDHPTQKPEKLIAKLLLASSQPGDVVLDPFLGSGTTSVVAQKLGRRYIGIEQEELYCCWAEKRLAGARG